MALAGRQPTDEFRIKVRMYLGDAEKTVTDQDIDDVWRIQSRHYKPTPGTTANHIRILFSEAK